MTLNHLLPEYYVTALLVLFPEVGESAGPVDCPMFIERVCVRKHSVCVCVVYGRVCTELTHPEHWLLGVTMV